ncbi:MAG: PEP-utilizing enzyme [Patescibacteria group bacterium]
MLKKIENDLVIHKQISNHTWLKYWEGKWSFATGFYFAWYYTNLLKKQMGEGLNHIVLISRRGRTACYFEIENRGKFGRYLANKAVHNKNFASKLCKKLKKKADKLVAMSHKFKGKDLKYKEFKIFFDLFFEYTGMHISPRNIIDYLPANSAQKFLPILQDARLYTEKVFVETEIFMQELAKVIAKKFSYKPEYILCLTKNEFEDYFEKGKLPKKDILVKRFSNSAIIFKNKKSEIITGNEVIKIEKALSQIKDTKEIKGMTAYPGKAQGIVKIISDPKKAKDFHDGDILVTGMTRPEFLLLMKKSSAIITDAGGLLCHAAITAREIKKPCVIGTQVATKALKNGDKVEVDADRGIVRKLN